VVLSTDDAAPDDSKELADDILAINTVFICRLQGRRAGQYRRLRRQQQQEVQTQEIASSQEATNNRSGDTINESESIPECETEAIDETMDGLC
jgi:predicted HNH restriction endonuclease